MSRVNSDTCACCGENISHRGDGISGVYSPDLEFLLCEDCWYEEEAEIDERGTNDLPHRIVHYKKMLGLLEKK